MKRRLGTSAALVDDVFFKRVGALGNVFGGGLCVFVPACLVWHLWFFQQALPDVAKRGWLGRQSLLVASCYVVYVPFTLACKCSIIVTSGMAWTAKVG